MAKQEHTKYFSLQLDEHELDRLIHLVKISMRITFYDEMYIHELCVLYTKLFELRETFS